MRGRRWGCLVKTGENFHALIPEGAFGYVRMMWGNYHPEQIADTINTKYSLWRTVRLDGRAVYNMRQHIVALDREAAERR